MECPYGDSVRRTIDIVMFGKLALCVVTHNIVSCTVFVSLYLFCYRCVVWCYLCVCLLVLTAT